MIKHSIFLLILISTYAFSQEENNLQKFYNKLATSIVNKEQYINSYPDELFNSSGSIFILNKYNIDEQNILTNPAYFRFDIDDNNKQYWIQSIYMQLQSDIKRFNNIHFSALVWIQNNIKNSKTGLGVGTFQYYDKKIGKNKNFHFELVSNLFPLMTNDNKKFSGGLSIIPNISLSIKQFNIALDLFTFAEYQNGNIDYLFNPILTIGINSFQKYKSR
ncbi:MAG: hypothetical protein JXQ65_02410 [Candidatus Marinimicrobia bacterium]|nr:hypothetical protein [Candidatus Neomarinimicrobiota bacterium]